MAHAEINNDVIKVTSTWQEKELIKTVPGSRWNAEGKHWTVPLTWAACVQLRGTFDNALTVGPELTQWSWDRFHEVKHSLDIRDLVERDKLKNPKLYPFQDIGVDFAIGNNALIADELGLGKTITGLNILQRAHSMLPALIICPNSVKHSWSEKTQQWFPEATPYIIQGNATERRKILSAARLDPTAVVIMNLEAVRLFSRLKGFGSIRLTKCIECDKHGNKDLTPTKCEVHPKELNNFGFKTVMVDEIHRLKEPKSKVTRACWAVGHDDSVLYRYGFTGTPIANHVGDLWSIMHFIEPNEWPSKSRTLDRYALQSWNAFGGLDIVGINPMKRVEFEKVFHPRFRRTLKAQVLDQLPTKVRSVRYATMEPKQRKAYKELDKQQVTELADKTLLTVQDHLQLSLRKIQLASSYMTVQQDANGLDVVILQEPSPKLDVMEEILEDIGDVQVVIAAQSRQLIELAAKRFMKKKELGAFGMITGKQDEWERQTAIDQFKAGDLRAILMTIDAGGTGVDGLQCANTMIILQRSYSMVANVQLEGRIDRIGSEKHDSIHFIDIVAEDTIEETSLFPALQEKFARLDEITNDRAKLIAQGMTPPAMFDLEETEIMKSRLF